LRRSFRPPRVRILFIEESTPQDGKSFYEGCATTLYTSRAFEHILDRSFSSTEEFLQVFMTQGCYLDDLSLVPVAGKSPKERESLLRESVPSLATRIRKVAPEAVVVVLKKIEVHVRGALDLAGVRVPTYVLPFPGRKHGAYVDCLAEILKAHLGSRARDRTTDPTPGQRTTKPTASKGHLGSRARDRASVHPMRGQRARSASCKAPEHAAELREFLEVLLKAIVSHPDAIQVSEVVGSGTALLQIRVDPEDMACLIGNHHINIRAIQHLLECRANRNSIYVRADLLDSPAPASRPAPDRGDC
jgi:predicted RNA-binding protein YlqC (UPF0109 family)